MTRTLERRTIPSQVKVRDEDGRPRMIFGHAAMFNVPSQDLGGFVEILKPGCFARTLQGGDQRAFFNHCYDHLIGRTKSGTLRLEEDEVGLAFEVDIDDTTIGLDTWKMVKRGDVDGVSFGFYALKDEWSPDGKTNTVLEAELIEISPVVFPAYLQPRVEARSTLDGPINADRLARRPKPRYARLERAMRIIRLDDEA